jgi:hypothetical protein
MNTIGAKSSLPVRKTTVHLTDGLFEVTDGLFSCINRISGLWEISLHGNLCLHLCVPLCLLCVFSGKKMTAPVESLLFNR